MRDSSVLRPELLTRPEGTNSNGPIWINRAAEGKGKSSYLPKLRNSLESAFGYMLEAQDVVVSALTINRKVLPDKDGLKDLPKNIVFNTDEIDINGLPLVITNRGEDLEEIRRKILQVHMASSLIISEYFSSKDEEPYKTRTVFKLHRVKKDEVGVEQPVGLYLPPVLEEPSIRILGVSNGPNISSVSKDVVLEGSTEDLFGIRGNLVEPALCDGQYTHYLDTNTFVAIGTTSTLFRYPAIDEEMTRLTTATSVIKE